MKDLRVRDVMSHDVPTVGPDASYKRIAELLSAQRIRAVPVVDSRSRLLGIVSESDLIRRNGTVSGSRKWRRSRRPASRLTAHELMTSPARHASPDVPIARIAKVCAERDLRQLPVVDEDDVVLGMVSRIDLLKVFERADDEIREEIVHTVVTEQFCIPPMSVDVAVLDGVVTIRGQLEHAGIDRSLVQAVRAVPGVVDVLDRLTWPETPRKPAFDSAMHVRAT